MKEILKNVYTWSLFSDEKKLNFNGWFVPKQHPIFGNVVIDPPRPRNEDIDHMKSLGGVQQIIITNRNHGRWSEELKKAFGSEILMNAADAATVDISVDRTFEDDAMVGGFLKTVLVPNNKSPGETALYWSERKILILGDALIGNPPGKLSLLPSETYTDVELAREGIKVLLDLEFESLLVGDGESILQNGKEAVENFLQSAESE